MIPQQLTNETRNIGKPRDWNDEVNGPCESLSVHDYIDEQGHNWMISRWKPTDRELQILNAGGDVQLHINGYIHPVVSVWVPE